jgi:uncharacterized damage-inducible protein DinB
MESPSIKEVAVRVNREINESLITAITAMPPEKLRWRPLETGRDALDILIECAEVNVMASKLLALRTIPPRDPEGRAQKRKETDTLDKGIEFLRSSVESLIAAIQAFPEEHLNETVRIGPLTKTYAEVMVFVYAHSSYHFGQIGYIQTLYGDTEMRF